MTEYPVYLQFDFRIGERESMLAYWQSTELPLMYLQFVVLSVSARPLCAYRKG